SRTVRASGPIWSVEEANATRPWRDTRPYVGLRPTTPQNAAGWRIEPPVSEPKPSAALPAAAAAAGPPREPPGTGARSHGVRGFWNAEFAHDEPIANSSMFARPRTTAPAPSSRSTAVAVYGAT